MLQWIGLTVIARKQRHLENWWCVLHQLFCNNMSEQAWILQQMKGQSTVVSSVGLVRLRWADLSSLLRI